MRKHSIWMDIFLTLITGGLFNLWVQVRQIWDANEMLDDDRFGIFKLIFLSIVTFGIYFAFHEYKMTRELHERLYKMRYPEIEIACGIATFFAMWFFVDSYQQVLMNQWAEKHPRVTLN